MTSPNPRPNMMYEWRGHKPPRLGWRYELETMERLFAEGRIELAKKEGGRPRLRRFLDEMPGVPIGSIWTDIHPVNSQASEDTGYDTQKPKALLERALQASSNPGDLVADFFCGSARTPSSISSRASRTKALISITGRWVIERPAPDQWLSRLIARTKQKI